MDTQIIFNIAIACAGGLALWVLNEMTRKIQRLEDKLENLPHDYVQKDDYRGDIKEIKDILRQIFDKLDNKQDKAS
jgi:hypothetical protein